MMITILITILTLLCFIVIFFLDKEIKQLKNKLHKQNSEQTKEYLNFKSLELGYIKQIKRLQEEVSELQELNNISIKEFENLTLKQKRYILTAIKKVGLPFCETEDIRAWNVFKPNNRIVKITMNERGFIHFDEEGKEYDPDKIITKKEEYIEFLENELNNIKKSKED